MPRLDFSDLIRVVNQGSFMEAIFILILNALLVWAVEQSAEALLNWVIERIKRDSEPPTSPENPGESNNAVER